MGNKGMNHYEVGATQGHSKSKVDSMIKKAKSEGKKLSAKSSAIKNSIHSKMKHLDKPAKGNADKSPRTAKADY